MSKPKHARQLADLPKPYHTAAMAEVARQTDRGAAIVGAAYVDIVLREAITARLHDLPDITKQLFEHGPLQEFGARIPMGFALGVFGRRAYNDLLIIRNVRNAFAHSAEAMDFDRSDIARFCKDLWFPRKISYRGRQTPSTSKELFISAIELLTDGLHEDLSRQKARLPPNQFLMMGPSANPPSTGTQAKTPHRSQVKQRP